MLAIWFIFMKLEITLTVPSSVSGVFVQTGRTQGQDRNGSRPASDSALRFLMRKVDGLMVLL